MAGSRRGEGVRTTGKEFVKILTRHNVTAKLHGIFFSIKKCQISPLQSVKNDSSLAEDGGGSQAPAESATKLRHSHTYITVLGSLPTSAINNTVAEMRSRATFSKTDVERYLWRVAPRRQLVGLRAATPPRGTRSDSLRRSCCPRTSARRRRTSPKTPSGC